MWMIIVITEDFESKIVCSSAKEMIEHVIGLERNKKQFKVYHCQEITSTITNTTDWLAGRQHTTERK